MAITRAQSRQHAEDGAAQRHGSPKKKAYGTFPKSVAVRREAALATAVTPSLDNEITLQDHRKAPDLMGNVPSPLHLMRRSSTHFGLIQERLPSSELPGSATHVYCLLVQSLLWNQTRGKMALPVLKEMLRRFPNPALLARASETDLEALLQPIGLWRQRAKRLIKLGQTWLDQPPCASRTYKKKGYPLKQVEHGDQAWEVAHLPGVGPYALDAFRIFSRDGMRNLAGFTINPGEEEWKRVLPTDKDLRAYLIWRWERDSWSWDPMTGNKTLIDDIKKQS